MGDPYMTPIAPTPMSTKSSTNSEATVLNLVATKLPVLHKSLEDPRLQSARELLEFLNIEDLRKRDAKHDLLDCVSGPSRWFLNEHFDDIYALLSPTRTVHGYTVLSANGLISSQFDKALEGGFPTISHLDKKISDGTTVDYLDISRGNLLPQDLDVLINMVHVFPNLRILDLSFNRLGLFGENPNELDSALRRLLGAYSKLEFLVLVGNGIPIE